MSICTDMETDYLIQWSETPDEILIKFGQSSARIRSKTLGLKNPRIPARWPEMSGADDQHGGGPLGLTGVTTCAEIRLLWRRSSI